MQGARNRRGGHGQDINLVAHLLESLFVGYTEALFFIDDQQAEIEKDDIFLQQTMGADDNVNLTQSQVLQYLLLLFV